MEASEWNEYIKTIEKTLKNNWGEEKGQKARDKIFGYGYPNKPTTEKEFKEIEKKVLELLAKDLLAEQNQNDQFLEINQDNNSENENLENSSEVQKKIQEILNPTKKPKPIERDKEKIIEPKDNSWEKLKPYLIGGVIGILLTFLIIKFFWWLKP